jgi:hypothetical protein
MEAQHSTAASVETVGEELARARIERLVFRICLVALIVSVLLFVMGLGMIYWGDEYAVPAWSEQSMPPPAPPY